MRTSRCAVFAAFACAVCLLACDEDEGLCGETQQRCGGVCVRTDEDPQHCGACGQRCPAGASCAAGVCLEGCGEERVRCGETCVDLRSDAAHCGGCGLACAQGEICVAASCRPACDGEARWCGGECVDLHADRRHCGDCGVVCDAGESCEGGTCVSDCVEGERSCGGRCVDTERDAAHCGDCGQRCAEGFVCEGGSCVCPGSTQQVCGGACVETETDVAHCGGCDRPCVAGANVSGAACEDGRCVLECEFGYEDCDGDPSNGCEVSLFDDAHCGACGVSCSEGAQVDGGHCYFGECALACFDGWGNCDLDPATGCEVDLRVEIEHCGACGNDCRDKRNVVWATCVEGACSVETCFEGFADCDEKGDNGCEVDLTADPENCGACGEVCTACGDGACRRVGSFAGGSMSMCLRWEDGGVSCWGHNNYGQLGIGVAGDGPPHPVPVQGLRDAKLLVAGGKHNYALLESGTLVGWGERRMQSGDEELDYEAFYVPRVFEELPAGAEVVDLAASDSGTCAVLAGGEVWCWGTSQNQELGPGVVSFSYVEPRKIAIEAEVRQVAAGASRYCALTAEGRVLCWGGDNRGVIFRVLPEPTDIGLSEVDEIVSSIGGTFNCAILSDRTLRCWGSNHRGQLGDGNIVTPPSLNPEEPVAVVGLEGVVEAQGGHQHACARTEAGEIYCWGSNSVGQLGAPDVEQESPVPVKVQGLAPAIRLGVGYDFTCAVDDSHQVWCWGQNVFGQLGSGPDAAIGHSAVPLHVPWPAGSY